MACGANAFALFASLREPVTLQVGVEASNGTP
jgi:hypothetical protein